jgi:hypothetical protein
MTKHEELSEFLHTLRLFDANPLRIAKLTGFMVAGIRDSADLWQEAQDAYGMGADGLMDLIVDYGVVAASCYEALVGDPRYTQLVDERESNVETVFLWSVIEPFGEELAKIIRDSQGEFPKSVGVALLVGMIVDWLLGPHKSDRWYLELDNRTEGFYSKCETMQEAIADCMDYYGLVSDSSIRKIERIG